MTTLEFLGLLCSFVVGAAVTVGLGYVVVGVGPFEASGGWLGVALVLVGVTAGGLAYGWLLLGDG